MSKETKFNALFSVSRVTGNNGDFVQVRIKDNDSGAQIEAEKVKSMSDNIRGLKS